jgi:hypothetical protein
LEKKKRTSNCFPNTNHFSNSCVKRLTFIYMTLHSLVPNSKNFYNLKNNQLPMFITRSAKTQSVGKIQYMNVKEGNTNVMTMKQKYHFILK